MNESAFSAADVFEIDVTAPGVPALVSVSPDPTTARRPALGWGAVSGASDYRVQVSTVSDFASTLFDVTTASTSWTPTSDLPEGTVYWRASSRDALMNESEFSAADVFTIDVTGPPAVQGLTFVSADDVHWNLRWTPSTAPDFSHYAIYREAMDFSDVTGLVPIDTSITDPSVSQFVDPNASAGVFYAVVAVDTLGNFNATVDALESPSTVTVFADGFESGDLSGWSLTSP